MLYQHNNNINLYVCGIVYTHTHKYMLSYVYHIQTHEIIARDAFIEYTDRTIFYYLVGLYLVTLSLSSSSSSYTPWKKKRNLYCQHIVTAAGERKRESVMLFIAYSQSLRRNTTWNRWRWWNYCYFLTCRRSVVVLYKHNVYVTLCHWRHDIL